MQVHLFLTLALGSNELMALCSSHLTPYERTPSIHWIKGLGGPQSQFRCFGEVDCTIQWLHMSPSSCGGRCSGKYQQQAAFQQYATTHNITTATKYWLFMNTISPSIPNSLAQLQQFINYLMNSMLGCVQKVQQSLIYMHLHTTHTTIQYNHHVLLPVNFCVVLHCY